MNPVTAKNVSGLLMFFHPELILLIIWILFRSSILDILELMSADNEETASIRLIAISATLLAFVQGFRIFAFRLYDKFLCGSAKPSITTLIIVTLIFLGVVSEFQDIKNIMHASYPSTIVFFVAMAGLVYLSIDIICAFVLHAKNLFKEK